MNVASRTTGGLKQSVAAFWAERNRREQNMLIAATVVVVLGLIYALIIDPALSGRGELKERLPALRQQAAEVQDLSKEAAAMNRKAGVPAPALTQQSIEASLARKGLQAQNVTLTGETVRLQFNNASFSSMIDWLAEMQRTARLSVTEATISALEQADRVNATLSLRQQRSEQEQ
jgi:general secretion pathway protein M